MHIVILGAGKGSRVEGYHVPKSLLPLSCGKTILGFQLEVLKSFISLTDVTVVVGYKEKELKKAFPFIKTISNPSYAIQNTAKSLFLGLDPLDDDVIWINGDVVFHPAAFQKIYSFGKNAVLVNRSKVGEEEVKYQVDDQGLIQKISKKVYPSIGEALGINYIQKKHLPLFKEMLSKCHQNDYFEQAIEKLIDKGVEFSAIEVEESQCIEIDYKQDLQKADQLISSWNLFNNFLDS